VKGKKLLRSSQFKQPGINSPEQTMLCDKYSVSEERIKVPQSSSWDSNKTFACVWNGYCENFSKLY